MLRTVVLIASTGCLVSRMSVLGRKPQERLLVDLGCTIIFLISPKVVFLRGYCLHWELGKKPAQYNLRPRPPLTTTTKAIEWTEPGQTRRRHHLELLPFWGPSCVAGLETLHSHIFNSIPTSTIHPQIFLPLLPNNLHYKFHKVQEGGQEYLLV